MGKKTGNIPIKVIAFFAGMALRKDYNLLKHDRVIE